MSLWWLHHGWTDTCCSNCGARIYPEGDPDWGLCWPCMNASQSEQQQYSDCPLCGGDCAGANPPVVNCPMREPEPDEQPAPARDNGTRTE